MVRHSLRWPFGSFWKPGYLGLVGSLCALLIVVATTLSVAKMAVNEKDWVFPACKGADKIVSGLRRAILVCAEEHLVSIRGATLQGICWFL